MPYMYHACRLSVPLQSGLRPLHPLEVHVLSEFPTNSNPVLQLKVTVDPSSLGMVGSLYVLALPLTG